MCNAIGRREYVLPPVKRREVFRYAGGESEQTARLLDECIAESEGAFAARVCFREFAITRTEQGLDLGFALTDSRDLQAALADCTRVVVFAATVGLAADRLIARYSQLSPAKALLFQALGAERVERACDLFCEEMREQFAAQGCTTRTRFSPGYGDLPLALQRAVFAALDCPRQIGLSLNDSLLMSPSKSVTAIIGIV